MRSWNIYGGATIARPRSILTRGGKIPENSDLKARAVDDKDTLKATVVTVDTVPERFCPAHTVNLREVIQDGPAGGIDAHHPGLTRSDGARKWCFMAPQNVWVSTRTLRRFFVQLEGLGH